MRVLFLSQGRTVADHPGWEWSLAKLKAEGYIEDYLNIPWIGYGEQHGWDEFYDHVVRMAGTGFDVVYFHHFHKRKVPASQRCFDRLKLLNPMPVVIVSCGDGFSSTWMMPGFPHNFKVASRNADITFASQAGAAADKIIRWGAKNFVLSPLAMCPLRFRAMEIDLHSHKFDFDVTFIGSRNGCNRPNLISNHFWAGRKREKLVRALDAHFGKRLGLFGYGWDCLQSNQGPSPFDKQQETFRRGRITVGGSPYLMTDYYMSNRPFLSISSGIPTVELKTPRMDKILRENDQVYFAESIEGIIAKCEELLKMPPDVLYAKAAAAAKEMELKHTQYHRMKFKLDTVKRYVANGRRLDVKFPFFLPEDDLGEEARFAIRSREP